MKEYELILVILNRGYADEAMEAAKAVGARGGTILNARGTGAKQAERFYGLTLSPEKELLLILVPGSIRQAVMSALNEAAGVFTPAHGLCFSMEVEQAVGLVERDTPHPGR